MKILAIETSGATASVAVMDEGNIVAEYMINNKKTHSQTLLPMVEDMLGKCDIKPSDLDYIAVSAGPGSYTGLRIGLSTAKGIALGSVPEDSELKGIPCVSVSALEALAYDLCEAEGVFICPVADARNDRLYCGLYWFWVDTEGRYRAEAAIADTVMGTQELVDRLERLNRGVIFIGDGIDRVKEKAEGTTLKFAFASPHKNYPWASSVAEIALRKIENEEFMSPDELEAEYLSASQAERERFREMTHEDIEAVAAIESTSITPPWSSDSFESAIEREETCYVVCDIGGKIKGYAGMWIAADEAEITGVAVEPGSRGSGLGTDLVEYLLSKGRERGVKKFFLEVRKSNEIAINTYEKCGFKKVGERISFYRDPEEDAVVMRRE